MANYEQAGLMTDSAIRDAMSKYKMLIYPFDENNLTPVGYNFTFSNFIVSLSSRAFVNLKTDSKTGDTYFYLHPNETVLVLTRETIWVNKDIGGTFHSKVSLVTQGLGHISTTLDPGWKGQLLAPLNNPTKHKIKVYISKGIRSKCENPKERNSIPCSFITLVMYRCSMQACKIGDNRPARLELLERILLGNKKSASRVELAKIISSINEHFVEYSQNNLYSDVYNNKKYCIAAADSDIDDDEFETEKQKGLDANDLEVRRYVTDEYIYQQRILNVSLHNRYLDVIRVNRALLRSSKVSFAVWAVILVGIGLGGGFALYHLLEIQLFSPIIGVIAAFLSVVLAKLMDKYL